MTTPRNICITGLSGAGKSSLAAELPERLKALGQAAVMLHGDESREVFGSAAAEGQNHSRKAGLALQYARPCQVNAYQGLMVVIATIRCLRKFTLLETLLSVAKVRASTLST